MMMALGVGWYFAALVRTTVPGFRLRIFTGELLFALIIAGPIMVVAFLGLGWTRIARGVAVVTLSSVLMAEVWAGAEEVHFRSRHEQFASGAKARFVFSDSWLSFDPSTGELHGGD